MGLSIHLSFPFELDLRANHLRFSSAEVIVLAAMVLRLRLLVVCFLERFRCSAVGEADTGALVVVTADSVV